MSVNLNPQQQALVDFILNETGSCNLIARAGTGKTFSLVNGAVQAIIINKLGSVALMAFNKSAAVEFEQRIEKLADETNNPDLFTVDTGTVHSFGFRFWRRYAGNVKVDAFKVSNIVREKFGTNNYYEFLPQVTKLVSLAKQAALTPDGLRENAEEILAHFDIDVNGNSEEITDVAVQSLDLSNKQRQIIDFDDMIYLPVLYDIKTDEYDFVLIDEAQDTNPARRLLAFKMMKANGRLIAVGDDRQAIYGFTGANSNSLELIKQALNSTVLPLTVTYRCPKAVVAEANSIVSDFTAHESAPDGIVRDVNSLAADSKPWFVSENVTANDAALCRNTKPLIEQAYSFFRNNIACRVEGRDIGDGLIQLATKWRRITTLGALLDRLEEYQVTESAKWTAKNNPAKVQQVEDKCDTLRVIIDHLLNEGLTTVADLTRHIKSLFGDTPEGEKPRVFTLSTIHKAKGKEWDRVYFLRHDLLPSKYAKQEWQLEQENNLLYVAITRAKSELIYVDW